jgi:CHAT domain-containing protein/tetratricopeptide (TPR) repeat protein
VNGDCSSRDWESSSSYSSEIVSLHAVLGVIPIFFLLDDPARHVELAWEHLSAATAVLLNRKESEKTSLLAAMWGALGLTLLGCAGQAGNTDTRRALQALQNARQQLTSLPDAMEPLPPWIVDGHAWDALAPIARLKYWVEHPLFGRRFKKGKPTLAAVRTTTKNRIATVDWHLGIAYRRLGNFDNAIKHYNLAIAGDHGIDSRPMMRVGRGLAYLDLAEGRQDRLERAEAEFCKIILDNQPEPATTVMGITAIMGLTRVYLSFLEGNPVKLKGEQLSELAKIFDPWMEDLRKVMRFARKRSAIQTCKEASLLLGRIYRVKRDYGRAFKALALASRLSDRSKTKARTIRAKQLFAETDTTLHDQLIHVAMAYKADKRDADLTMRFVRSRVVLRSALSFSERSRVAFLQEELHNRELLPNGARGDDPDVARLFEVRRGWHLADLQVREREELGGECIELLVTDEMRHHRNELEAEYARKLEGVRQKFEDSAYDPDRAVTPASFAQIQSAVNHLSTERDTALVEYHITDRKVFVFVLFPRVESYPFTFFPRAGRISPHEVEEVAEEWSHGLRRVRPAPEILNSMKSIPAIHWGRSRLPRTLQRLKDLATIPYKVVNDWEKSTGRKIERMIVVPHRFLHLIPIHALELPSGERWGDTVTIQYVPSASILCRLLSQVRSEQPCQSNALAGATTVAVAWSSAESLLPWAAREARSVAEILDGCVLEGQDATTQRVIEAIRNADYVHFACHGRYDGKNPLGWALQLAPDKSMESRALSQPLTLAQIFECVRFTRSPVVVLSACETGVAKVGRINDDCLGLAAGFLYAGARTVVGTLWRVDDLATSLLITRMTHELKSGASPAEALRRAQQWLRTLPGDTIANEIVAATDPSCRKEEWLYFSSTLKGNELEPFPFAEPYWWAGFVVNGVG